MNNITLTGINQRMEVKTAGSGKPWVTGTIRTRNKMPNKEGKYDSSFHDYKVLGARAETFAKFQQEGKPLALSGWLNQEKWTDKDGQNRSKSVVMVEDFDLPPLDDNAPNQSARKAEAQRDPFAGGPIDLDDSDLPF